VAAEAVSLLRRPAPWRWVLLLLLALVSWLAFMPQDFNDRGLPLDKLRHLLAFAVLAWVGCQAWGSERGRLPAVAAGLFGYGLFIELVQSQIPSRVASVGDLASNTLGITLGLWMAWRLSLVR
jgi:VanZ family protein